ncbi:MAG TPA: hypothetical protein VG938_17500 [Verrucomicrobiae bacterium]|nr:hypothetical protein [Verrucomicrobiae bacterium]
MPRNILRSFLSLPIFNLAVFSPAELSLRLRSPRWRPLGDTDCVKWALDVSAEEIEQLIDLGCLVVFDISVTMESRSPLMSHRRELRFLTRSIEHYRLTLGMRRLDLTWPQITRLILPPDKKALTGVEIDAALNCDPNHRLNLIRAGELEPPRGRGKLRATPWSRGRNCGAKVTRESLEEFLRRRKL